MGQNATKAPRRSTTPSPRGDVVTLGEEDKIVLTKVEIVKQREVVKIPELVIEKRETIEYIPVQKPTIEYVVEQRPTVRYDVREEPTVKYVVDEQETTKYVTQEVACEKPVLVEKVYERPVLQEKTYTIVTYDDIEAIRELMDLAPKLLSQLRELRDYKIVEEVIEVPKIQYVPTTIKKIRNTGELVDDAD